MKNPFSITKAVDFSDNDINKYWVDFSGSFDTVIEPTDSMTKIILGSKGSGKTHLMKYYTYELQKLRCKPDLKAGLQKDKYIGLFMRSSGLNSERFCNKGFDEGKQMAIFSYNFELWLGQIIIRTLIDLQKTDIISDSEELNIVKHTLSLFDQVKDDFESIKTFDELNRLLVSYQHDLDYKVNNSVFSEVLPDVEILLTPGNLIYNIPKYLHENLEFFSDKMFIYFIDELENITENQQTLIQSLIREKPPMCTFRLGARLYGIKTYKTLGKREENKEGSEYTVETLDNIFLEQKENYIKFIKEICVKRINGSLNAEIEVEDLKKFYEEIDEQEIIRRLKEKKSKILALTRLKNILKPHLSEEQTSVVIDNLRNEDDLLLQITNIYLFYKKWKNSKHINKDTLVGISKEIKSKIDNKDWEEHLKINEYYKGDFFAKLTSDILKEVPYYGFDILVKMSSGNPRNILNILKHTHKWVMFENKIQPFTDKQKISAKCQSNGLKDAIEWFFEENRIPVINGLKITDPIDNLGNYLKSLRFSDCPPNCSISLITIDKSSLYEQDRKILDYLIKYSYLIENKPRNDKNFRSKTESFYINYLLAPVWDLPINKRGATSLNPEVVNNIFNITDKEDFKQYVKKQTENYNAPFKKSVESSSSMLNLFDN